MLHFLFKLDTSACTYIVFNFVGDFHTTLKKELSDLAHKKDVTKVLTNCQKWIISQNCEITKKILQFKTMKHILLSLFSPGTVA